MFPAYFRYELPQAIFSSVELEALLQRIKNATDDDDRQGAFLEELNSMEMGAPRRDDFLRKLSDVVGSLTPGVGQVLVHAAMQAADEYVYDSVFLSLGEAGHVLRIVMRVAQITPKPERAALLSQCTTEAADDTMALRILTTLTRKQGDLDLGVSFAQLYPAFIKRMRHHYGRHVDATNTDLRTSDPNAFNLWGSSELIGQTVAIDSEDRAIEYDFWRRYIGNSRLRLARAFRDVLMPIGVYAEDPTLSVENKIPIADLRRLYNELPDDETLTELDRESLRRLHRFLNGEFRNGIGPAQLDDPPANGENDVADAGRELNGPPAV